MDTVVISPAFQVRLPRHVCDALGLLPGQRLRVVEYEHRVELVPIRPVLECEGLFRDPVRMEDTP